MWQETAALRDFNPPMARDVALDPGGTTMPRIAALHMLRSTIATVSAPTVSSFRGSITHPTQPLCTLRVRRRRRLTQHSLPGGLLDPTWAGLAPADRASFAGAFFTRSPRRRGRVSVGGISQAERLGGLEVDHKLEFSRLLDREIGGSRSLEDAVDEKGSAT